MFARTFLDEHKDGCLFLKEADCDARDFCCEVPPPTLFSDEALCMAGNPVTGNFSDRIQNKKIHKTSATLGQACVADISKVSSLYYKNSLFHWRSKNVLQMSSPTLQAHLDPAGKILDDPPAFLPWDRSYCCCDCCLQVRDKSGGCCHTPRP